MAIDTINIGNLANDGTGDDLREAFIKVNNNFNEFDNRVADLSITGENLGSAGEGIFAGKVPGTLQFKEIIAGDNISVSANSTSVIIDSAGGITDILVLLDNGHISIDGTAPTRISGGDIIETRAVDGDIVIDLEDRGILAHDKEPTLSSNLRADNNDIHSVAALSADSVTAETVNANLEGTVFGIDIRGISDYIDGNWDFGEFFPKFNNVFDYLVFNTDVDMGSFVGDDTVIFDIDLGLGFQN